jgi:hypothetical protein
MKPTESKPPLPAFQYLVLLQLFLALVVAVRPKVVWRFAAFLLILYLNLRIITFTTGDIDRDYALSVAFGCLIANALHLLLVTDPTNDFRHANDLVPPRDLPLLRKAYWAFCLQNAARGIGWNYEVRYIWLWIFTRSL